MRNTDFGTATNVPSMRRKRDREKERAVMEMMSANDDNRNTKMNALPIIEKN